MHYAVTRPKQQKRQKIQPLLQKRQVLLSSHPSQKQKSDAVLASLSDKLTNANRDKAGLATKRDQTKKETLDQYNAAIRAADDTLEHTPIAEQGAPCICLAATDAPLRFNSIIPRLLQPLLRI